MMRQSHAPTIGAAILGLRATENSGYNFDHAGHQHEAMAANGDSRAIQGARY